MNESSIEDILTRYSLFMRNKIMDSSLRTYVHELKKYLKSMDGNSLNGKHAQAYIDKQIHDGVAPSSINLRANVIMSYFKWNGKAVELDRPDVMTKRPEYLKKEEVLKTIDSCQTVLEKTLIIMLYDTAVRVSELLNLKLNNIDWSMKTILVTRKGGRQTEVNVSDKAIDQLRRWLSLRSSGSDEVFPSLKYGDAWRIIRDIGKRAEISNVHPHIFRHSRAIHMLRDGVPINVVSQHLGHKSIKTTIDVYGQFDVQDIREQLSTW